MWLFSFARGGSPLNFGFMRVYWTMILALVCVGGVAQSQDTAAIDVLEYEISLGLTPDENGLEGQTWVTIVVPDQGADTLTLKLDTVYTINKYLMADANAEHIASVKLVREGKWLHFTHYNTADVQRVNGGDTVRVFVDYTGTPSEPARFGGVYFGEEGYIYNLGVRIGVTHPSDGHSWFPAHDVFTDKARFKYRIHTPDSRLGVANGMLTDVVNHNTDERGEINTYHWELRQPIPPYLASFAIGEYLPVRDTIALQKPNGDTERTPISLYVPPEDSAAARASFKHLPQTVAQYADWYGPYAWPRIGYVAVPMKGGAMEHATNIAYPQNAVDGGHKFDELWAHELSHSWFGNYVTCYSPEEMWLNEGWACYSEAMYHLAVHGEASFRDYLRDIQFKAVMYAQFTDGGYLPLSPMPRDHTYGTTTYKKGATVAHTLRNYIGDADFFPALRSYFAQYGYGNARTVDFLSHFADAKSDSRMMHFAEAHIFTPGWFQLHLLPNKRVSTFNDASYMAEDFLTVDLVGGKPKRPVVMDLELMYVSKAGQTDVQTAEIDWKTKTYKNQVVLQRQLPFEPAYVVVDPYEKFCDGSFSHLFPDSSYGAHQVLAPVHLSAEFPNGLPQRDVCGPVNIALYPHAPADRLVDTTDAMTGFWHLQCLPEAELEVQFQAQRMVLPRKVAPDGNGQPGIALYYKANLKDEWARISSDVGGADQPYCHLKNAKAGYYTLRLMK